MTTSVDTVYLTLPIYWEQPGGKTVLVGMNAYRNWHYRVSHKFKLDFTELVLQQLTEQVTLTSPYELELGIYYKNVACDGSNVAALIEKAVLDALVTAGVTVDDSVKHHHGTQWKIMGQDRGNPRCEILFRRIIDE